MTLEEYIDTLTSERQFHLAIQLTKLTLPIWDDYASRFELKYRDTVVGLTHHVNKDLLAKTIDKIEEHNLRSGRSATVLLELRREFDEPITALQDTDWELPDQVEKAFYSVFNLLKACLGERQNRAGNLTVYVSINQAADALETSKSLTFEEIKEILYDMKNGR